ncbi:hypothetical protein SAMN05216370_0074 [Pseudomonas peli]|uniref:Uncharacterized protein n=1 Tax=Pseudomonas peli TaxID=592361 RepID=A0AB37ZDD6_9PSED|nr:hypothetical protein SAMN05216370_0074 [Pseudomonas peli]
MQPTRIICKQPDAIGGDYATTILPEDHQGPVSLVVRNSKGKRAIEATFPTLKEANTAACYAVSPGGGYSEVEIIDGAGHPVTHTDWQEWAM